MTHLNVTMLLTDGPLEEQARYLLTGTLDADHLPDETSLLATEGDFLQTPTGAASSGREIAF
jgi:hypothetical protein